MKNMLKILRSFFRPIKCYRKWYKMSFSNEQKCCDCLIKCKYPPPSTPSSISIPIYNEVLKREQQNMIILCKKMKLIK